MPLYNPSSGGGSALAILDEGVSVHAAATSINFTGGGVAATASGAAVTVASAPAQGFIGAHASGSSVSVPNATYPATPFAMGSEAWDTDGFHDTVTNNSRFTIPAGLGGKYLLTIQATWDGNTSGERFLYYMKNGADTTPIHRGQGWLSASGSTVHGSMVVGLDAGDYVEVGPYQTSGSTRTLSMAVQLVKLDSGKVGQGIGAQAYNSTTQSISDATTTALTFDSEAFDTDGFHSTSSNTSRMTIPAGLGGKYLLVAGGRWDEPTATLASEIWFRKNGSTTLYGSDQGHAKVDVSFSSAQSTAVADLAAGDYVEVMIYQDSSGAQTFGHASANEARAAFSIMRLDSGSSDVQSGTAFPTPVTNMRFFRTDLGMEFYYDGTRWLSTAPVVLVARMDPAIDDPWTSGFGATQSNCCRVMFPTFGSASLDFYWQYMETVFYVGTPNDGTRYYTLGDGTTVASTQSLAADTTLYLSVTANRVISAPAQASFAFTKVSTPGHGFFEPPVIVGRWIAT